MNKCFENNVTLNGNCQSKKKTFVIQIFKCYWKVLQIKNCRNAFLNGADFAPNSLLAVKNILLADKNMREVLVKFCWELAKSPKTCLNQNPACCGCKKFGHFLSSDLKIWKIRFENMEKLNFNLELWELGNPKVLNLSTFQISHLDVSGQSLSHICAFIQWTFSVKA